MACKMESDNANKQTLETNGKNPTSVVMPPLQIDRWGTLKFVGGGLDEAPPPQLAHQEENSSWNRSPMARGKGFNHYDW